MRPLAAREGNVVGVVEDVVVRRRTSCFCLASSSLESHASSERASNFGQVNTPFYAQ